MLFRLLKVLRLFKLIKLIRLFSIRRLIARYQHDLFLVLPFLSVAQMFIVILFLGHLYGCFFYYFSTGDWRTASEKRDINLTLTTGQISTGRRMNPWIISEFGGEYGQPGTAGLLARYIGALYWAFATLCTVGYGDISAKTDAERVFAIISMITGGFVFSGVIAKIGSLVAKMDAAKLAHNDKMDAVTAFIRENQMPRELRSQVLIFFTKQQIRSYNVRTILSQLPYDLRSSILLYLYRDIIKKVPFFDGADDIFITDVCLRLKPVSYMAGSYIYSAGEIGRELLVLVKGEVEVLGPQKQVTRVLYEGSYFGEGSILGDVRRTESVRARTSCSLCALEADDLEELLMTYPDMDKMLRKVYHRRKQHFQSSVNTSFSSTSFSSEASPEPPRSNRRSTAPETALPHAPQPAEARRILSMAAERSKPAGKSPVGFPSELRLGAELPGESGRESRSGLKRLQSESLGFGSPPSRGEKSPGSDVEGRGEWKQPSRFSRNRVFPTGSWANSGTVRADAVVGGEPAMRAGSPERNGTEAGTENGTESPTRKKAAGTEELANGGPATNGNKAGRPPEENGVGNGGLGLVTDSVTEKDESPDWDVAAAYPEVGPLLSLERRRLKSDGSEKPPVLSSPKRRSSVVESTEPVIEAGEDEGGSGLSLLRTEIRTLKHEVRLLRTEHRRDAALLQEQYKTMMSLLIKVCRQTGEDAPGASKDFFVKI